MLIFIIKLLIGDILWFPGQKINTIDSRRRFMKSWKNWCTPNCRTIISTLEIFVKIFQCNVFQLHVYRWREIISDKFNVLIYEERKLEIVPRNKELNDIIIIYTPWLLSQCWLRYVVKEGIKFICTTWASLEVVVITEE